MKRSTDSKSNYLTGVLNKVFIAKLESYVPDVFLSLRNRCLMVAVFYSL